MKLPFKRAIIGGILGAVPGVILVGLTDPVSGEAELTLGVGGILLGTLGLLVGIIIGAKT